MLKPSIICLLLSSSLLFSEESSLSLDQKLKLKVIEAHWKDKDQILAKREIAEYLNAYPESSSVSHVHCLMADILVSEKNYEGALEHYEKLTDAALIAKSFEKKLLCLLMQKEHQKLREATQEQTLTDTSKRIAAQSYYEEALSTQDLTYQKQLLTLARNTFIALQNTPLKDGVLLPLAEIARFMKEYPLAASYFLKLSEIEEGKKNHYIFQTAQMYSFCDPVKAIHFFDKLRWSGSEFALQALLKEIQMLATLKRYGEILSLIDEELATGNNRTTAAILTYYQGKAYFCEGKLEEALASLRKALDSALLPNEIKKKALLAELFCARKLKNYELADLCLTQMEESYGADPDKKTALLVHLSQSLEEGKFEKAKNDLVLLQQIDLEPENKERYLLDEAILEVKLKNFEKASDNFYNFIKNNPSSANYPEASKQLLKSLCKMLEDPNHLQKNDKLTAYLAQIQKDMGHFNKEDKELLHFAFAKTYADSGKYARSLEYLNPNLTQDTSDKMAMLSHMLAAKVYEKLENSSIKSISHLEQAAVFEKDLSQKAALHIKIFNQTLSSNVPCAAFHLLQAFNIEPSRVEKNNTLWLAHYFMKKALQHPLKSNLSHSPTHFLYAQNAVRLFFHTFGTGTLSNLTDKSLDEHFVEALRLLILSERLTDATSYAGEFLKLRTENTPLCHEVKLLLAKVQMKGKNFSEASLLLNQILKDTKITHQVHQASLLLLAKVLQEELSSETLSLENEKVQTVLSLLKKLQLASCTPFEPLGYEAFLMEIEFKEKLGTPPETLLISYQTLYERYLKIQEELANSTNLEYQKKSSLIASYLNFTNTLIKQFTRSDKPATYGNEEDSYLEMLVSSDGDLLKERIYRLLR